MKIEEVEALELKIDAARRYGAFYTALEIANEALSALRAEAWHPIEKAAELGAKDGREVGLFRIDYWVKGWWDADYQCWMCHEGEIKPSHFRFFKMPEN